MLHKRPFNLKQYVDRTKSGPCFICEMIKGNPEYRHHIVFQDDSNIAFLNKYPPLYGYMLVAPIKHKVNVTSDFQLDQYLQIQRLIYLVSEAIRQTVPTERMYILSLGSHQGNSHVHWHIAPLPPNVPYGQQQFESLMSENGILDIPDTQMAELAARIRRELNYESERNR